MIVVLSALVFLLFLDGQLLRLSMRGLQSRVKTLEVQAYNAKMGGKDPALASSPYRELAPVPIPEKESLAEQAERLGNADAARKIEAALSKAAREAQETALFDAERFMRYPDTKDLEALLAMRGEHLPEDKRTACQKWIEDQKAKRVKEETERRAEYDRILGVKRS